jgi:mono/diheme cytochrome c family protein
MKIPGGVINWQARLLATVALCCAAFAPAAALAALAASGAQSQSSPKSSVPQESQPLIRSVEGPDLFHAYCASCHGKDAKGNGPAAVALKAKVPDLTLLAKNNGGRFPEDRVRKTILGDDVIAAHGSREMPVWGPFFHQIEEDVDRGNVRIANLVQYIKSIQSLK